MDAIGHFAVLPEPWGRGRILADKARYYGGYKQSDIAHARTALAEAGIGKCRRSSPSRCPRAKTYLGKDGNSR
jgi:hypothetical protein